MNKFTVLAGLTAALASSAVAQDATNHWRAANGPASETYITGGPWTLEQSGAGNGRKSSGYCDADGNQIGNPGTERMQPYYFPFVQGHGRDLQGYFDWRPKDTDEAVVAAISHDGGRSWHFQQKVLELRATCPTQVNPYPDGTPEPGPDPNNSDNGDDDGQGHQFVLRIAGHTYLYTLERANTHIDVDPLYVHDLNPTPNAPLNGAPAMNDGPTDENTGAPIPALHTNGLLNPDGILGVVPGRHPMTIIYEQKILKGDKTGATAFPAAQTCAGGGWASYYKANPYGTKTNDDITYLRLAETTDGINFKDLGALKGINDPTTVSGTGTRWVATAGTILRYHDGRYGLLYSGGNCVDGDSDAFHYIGYAESRDLLHWTVINGIQNPILSVAPFTMNLDSAGTPSPAGSPVTIPAVAPVVGFNGFYSGRVYAPSATIYNDHTLSVAFAGYHTPKPKNGLGDYRTIGQFFLSSEKSLEDHRHDDRD